MKGLGSLRELSMIELAIAAIAIVGMLLALVIPTLGRTRAAPGDAVSRVERR